jgi:beta-lactamase class A
MSDATEIRARSRRAREARPGRHAGESSGSFTRTFTALGSLGYGGAQVSANAVDLTSTETLISIDDRVVLPTASLGTILLLVEVSARLTARDMSGYGIVDKVAADGMGDVGLWQHLQVPALPMGDLAAFVASSSDSLATNLLLRQISLDAVRQRAESLGLAQTALLDFVRGTRGPDDAPQLSVGSTSELAWLLGALARGEIVDAVTSQRVMGWLSLNSDLSMVAGAFGLDPLAHRTADHELLLVNKTGTDGGVRCEVGALRGPRATVSYAVSVQFDDASLVDRLRVLDAMRIVGADLLDYVS